MKHYSFFFLCLAATSLPAQVLRIDSTQQLQLTQPAEKIELAPSGKFVLLSNYRYQGIRTMDLSTGQEQTVTEALGAGYKPKVLANGDILYREITTTPLKNISIKRYKAKTGQSATVLEATRENILPETTIEEDNIVTNQQFHLQLTLNGKTTVLAPLGDNQRYIWPSLSPNKQKILFYVSGLGTYVANLDGTNAVELGQIRAPKWYNNDIVVGQRDLDNGEVVTSSKIIAKNIQNKEEQSLTDDSKIAMYPSVSEAGDKILFSTPEGKAFLIHINNK